MFVSRRTICALAQSSSMNPKENQGMRGSTPYQNIRQASSLLLTNHK